MLIANKGKCILWIIDKTREYKIGTKYSQIFFPNNNIHKYIMWSHTHTHTHTHTK